MTRLHEHKFGWAACGSCGMEIDEALEQAFEAGAASRDAEVERANAAAMEYQRKLTDCEMMSLTVAELASREQMEADCAAIELSDECGALYVSMNVREAFDRARTQREGLTMDKCPVCKGTGIEKAYGWTEHGDRVEVDLECACVGLPKLAELLKQRAAQREGADNDSRL